MNRLFGVIGEMVMNGIRKPCQVVTGSHGNINFASSELPPQCLATSRDLRSYETLITALFSSSIASVVYWRNQ